MPGAPGMSGIETERDPIARDAACGDGVGDARQLIDGRPEPEPAARRVFEHDHRRVGLEIDLGEGAAAIAVRPSALDPGRDPALPMRPDVHVHEPAEEPRRRPQLTGEHLDGTTEEDLARDRQG